jgi:hypothetical protein
MSPTIPNPAGPWLWANLRSARITPRRAAQFLDRAAARRPISSIDTSSMWVAMVHR